jgi:hypothetical protein
MRVLSAKVLEDGRLDVPEGSLHQGATVTLLVPEEEEENGFEVSPEQKLLLLESIAQADRGEVVDGWKLLAEIGD